MSADSGKEMDSIVQEQAATLDEISDFVRVAAEHMRDYGLTSVDVEHRGTRIRLRSSVKHQKPEPAGAAPIVLQDRQDEHEDPATDDDEFITAPMIGTYYAAAGPGEPVFVEAGDTIEAGQTIGIIEAMKIMNEIAADRSGLVLEVLVRNAQAVEYGQPLLRIEPDDGG